MNIYDFDGTIYNGDSTVDFFLYAVKGKPSLLRFLPKQIAGFLLYGIKKIDKKQMKEYFFCFLSGIELDAFLAGFWEKNEEKIFAWYRNQKAEDDIVISASPEFLLKPICEKLHITHLIASKVDAATGVFVGENCRGEEKVKRLKAELGEVYIENFYSDSLSDLPLARLAENAFLIHNGRVRKWYVE